MGSGRPVIRALACGCSDHDSSGLQLGLLRGVAEVAFYGCPVALVGFFLVPVAAAVASWFVVAGFAFDVVGVALVVVPVAFACGATQ